MLTLEEENQQLLKLSLITSKQICNGLYGSLTETDCGNRVTYEAKMIADQVNESSMISGRGQQNSEGTRKIFQDL